jgi:hypothetical protein
LTGNVESFATLADDTSPRLRDRLAAVGAAKLLCDALFGIARPVSPIQPWFDVTCDHKTKDGQLSTGFGAIPRADFSLDRTPGVTQHGQEAQPQKKGHRLPRSEQGCAHRRSDDRRDVHTIARHPVFGPPAAAPLATGFCPTAALCTRRDHSESAPLE